MDVLEFLTHGNIKPNPNYNPKTKAGRYQAPTLVDYKPGNTIDDTLTSNIARLAAKNLYSFKQEDVDKYADYDVYLSPAYTEEELNKERANNQSFIEQTFRSVGQGIINEAAIGTVLGFSNLFDAGVNAIKDAISDEDQPNDFTNPLSSYLESVQDDLKERWEIYRTNPNETFDVTDFGWWADNFVSVATTASMLLPTVGASKVLSLIGRGIRTVAKAQNAGRVVKALDKIGTQVSAEHMGKLLAEKYGSKFKYLNDSGKVADMLIGGRTVVQNAVMSRTMEGYLEARDVYKQVEEDAYSRLQNFTKEERDKFFENNPNLQGKSDEEIAAYIAGKSAEETFRNDYAMLLMDVAQFRALGNLYKSGRKVSNANLALKARKAKNKILGITNKSTRPEWIDDNIFRLKYMAKHPLDGLFAVQWTEGIEEGYQGIQNEKGKEVAERMFDPNFTPRELSSYLSDPIIYEQAVWGILGGAAFAGISKGLGALSNKISHSDAVRNLVHDPATVAFMKLADQKARKEGIEGWADNINEFVKAVNDIKDGKDINNVTGQTKVGKDGTIQYGTLNETQIKYQLDRVINDFITDMALNADDRGNFDLFKEFITDPELVKHIKEQTKSDESTDAYINKLIEKLQLVSDIYNRETYKLRNSVHVNNPFVARKIAREAVRTRLNISDLNTELNNTNAQLNDLIGDNFDTYNEFEYDVFTNYIKSKLDSLDKEEQRHLDEYAKDKISKQAYEEYLQDINKSRKALIELANEHILPISQNSEFSELFSALKNNTDINLNTSTLNELLDKFNEFASQTQHTTTQNQSNAINNLTAKKIALLYNIKYAESQLPQNKTDYEREYAQHAMLIDKLTRKRYDDAADNVISWIEQQDNLQEAKHKLYTNQVDELKDDLDILKIGHRTTQNFWAAIDFALMDEDRKRQLEEQAKQRVTIDGQPVKEEEEKNTIRTDIENNENENDTAVPSTGQQQSTETSATTATTDTNNNEPQPATPVAPVEPIPVPAKPETPTITSDEDRRLAIEAQASRSLDINNATKKAFSIIRDMGINKNSRINNLNPDDPNDINSLIDEITERIYVETGIDAEICREAAIDSVTTRLKMNKRADAKNADKFEKLINNIALQARMSATGAIEFIEDIDEQQKLIDDLITVYCEIRGIKKTKSGNAIINLVDLYDVILNNQNINQSEALQFFTNFQGFLADTNKRNRLDKYMFRNIRDFNKLIKNPVRLREVIADIRNNDNWNSNYMHIAISNKNAKAVNIARQIKKDEELTAVYTPFNSKGYPINNIPFYYKGEEIGFIATVTPNSTNDGFTFNKTTGYRWTVRKIKNANGVDIYQLNETFDKFMSGVFNEGDPDFDKYDWFRTILQRTPHHEDLEKVYNMGIIQQLERDGVIPKTNNDGTSKAAEFISNIRSIMFYRANAVTYMDYYKSYIRYVKKLYDNAVFTYNLMLSKTSKIKFVNTWDGIVLYDEDNQWECGDKKYNFNAKDNPLVGVNSDGKFVIEGMPNEVPNPAKFKSGTMGFLLKLHDNAVAIAMVTGTKALTQQAHYNKLMEEELITMFTNYITRNNYKYKDLVKDLEDLFSGPTVSEYIPVLFRGLSVIKNDHGSMSLGYKDANKNNHYIIKINKYEYNTTNEKFDIRYIKGKNEIKINEHNTDFLEDCVKEIVSNLKFNASYRTLMYNKTKPTNNKSRFYTINPDGSIVITIGSETNTYDSYTDFVLKENIFYTNQLVNENGGFFNETGSNSIFVDASGVIPQDKQSTVPLEDYSRMDSKSPIATNNLLDSFDIDKTIQDFLLGNNPYNIPLIPDTIYFNSNMKNSKGKWVSKGDKIYIGKKLLDKSLDKSEPIRILVHEQIHRYFNQLDSVTQQQILNELVKTYTATIEALERDSQSDDANIRNTATQLLKWFKDEKFNPEQYGLKLDSRNKKKYYNSTDNERVAWFMEEWLVESITQQHLREYLNNVKYGTAVIGEPQTILAKILKLLMKIFGKNPSIIDRDIKNNTILATQFNILNGQTIDDTVTQNTKPVVNRRDTNNITDNEIDIDSSQQTDVSNNNINTDINNNNNENNSKDNNSDINDNDNDNSNDNSSDDIFKPDNLNTDFEIKYDIEKEDDEDRYATTSAIDIQEIENTIDANVISYTQDTKTNPKGIINISDMTEYLNHFSMEERPFIEKALNDGIIQYMCY